MSNDKKPAIRFKDYSDDWEQRKFSEMVIIERGGSPRPIDKFITNDENGLNWVKIGDAPEQGNYITKTAEKIKSEGLSKTREVHPGDLILSNSMSFGRPYIMAINGCIHDGWLAIRNTEKRFDLKFLCTLLGTDSMLDQYKAMAAGSTVNNLNKELVGSTTVSFPKIDEQVKIGEYFANLDNLIALHQRKYDKLQNLKKAMLEKMFPKNGSNVPEIRFKGFTDAWEQRKLENILSLENGFAFQSEYFVEEKTGYVVATPGNVSVEGGFICEGGKNYSVSAPFNERFIFKSGDIFVTMTDLTPTANTLGKPAIVPDNGIIYLHNQRLGKLVDYNCNKKFLFALLCTDKYHSQIVKTASGTTVRHSSPDKILSYETFVPKFEEQKMIGKFFSNLDHFIALHQRELEKLKNIKKAMLEKMFV